ncbi:hypothetical protein GGR52DRAFT_565492 [Hypoxylon sp. FL1284]|nr:hypothetical protein GGR52DRAFT_565492 [Hypoxylon sp. FL1284]
METYGQAPGGPSLRPRRALACLPCRRKKLRCDHNRPCSNCMRSRNKTCSYPTTQGDPAVTTLQDPSLPLPVSPPQGDSGDGEPRAASSSDAASGDIVGRRANQEWQSNALADVLVTISPGSKPEPGDSPSAVSKASTERAVHVDQDREAGASQPVTSALRTTYNVASYMNMYPISGIILKKRYFFPTHWVFTSTLAPFAVDWLEQQIRDQGPIMQGFVACKALARTVKSAMVLQWAQGEYGKHLPERGIADSLFEAYLRTFESIYRVLHIPTSRRAYEAMWDGQGLSALANAGHVVQLQLCLAIGACLRDDRFSLRPQALQWIREAEHWLETMGKPRMAVFTVQTRCLVYLARMTAETKHMNEHPLWISSGSLLRAAMSAGLHRDPTKLPRMPALEAEMRRRLWATIVELALDSSVDAGGPPMLSSDEFDCSLPLNLNDVDLDNAGDFKETACHDSAEFTDTSMQIALGRTFAVRLSVAKYANSIKAEHSPEEMARLSSELMSEYRFLAKSLHSLRPAPSKFQRQYCELVMTRYIFALHLTYLPRALKDPAQFHFSRTLCVDTALRLSSFWLPLSSSLPEPALAAVRSALPFEDHCDDFVHLVICGSGPFRSIPYKTTMVIAAEIAIIMHQAQYTSPWADVVPFNQTHMVNRGRNVELVALLKEAVKWTKARLHARFTSAKDIIFVAVVLAAIEAKMEGTQPEKAMDTMGMEILTYAKHVLSEMAGTTSPTWDNISGPDTEGLGISSEFWSIGFCGTDWDTIFH